MIALWCSPAVAINVTHGLQSSREPALIVAAGAGARRAVREIQGQWR
jgi:hypothetical protein